MVAARSGSLGRQGYHQVLGVKDRSPREITTIVLTPGQLVGRAVPFNGVCLRARMGLCGN